MTTPLRYNPDDWADITTLVQTTHKKMSPGQIICAANYEETKAMNGWIMMDPKLDPDSVSQPLRINALLNLSPSIIPLSPSLPQILSIVNHYFSQLQAVLSGSPIYPCLGSSLYIYQVNSITSPLLKTFTQLLIKLARRSYDVVVDQNIYQEEEFAECYEAHLKELDWCTSLTHDDLAANVREQKELLRSYCLLLIELIQADSDYFTTADSSTLFTLPQILHGASDKERAEEIIAQLKDSPFFAEIGDKYDILEQYVLLNGLCARLDYMHSLYVAIVSMTPILDLTFPDYAINTVNFNMQGIIDGLTHAMNVVWVYNNHIRTENTHFEQLIFQKHHLSPSQSISPVKSPEPTTPDADSSQDAQSEPQPEQLIDFAYRDLVFFKAYHNALNHADFRTQDKPFLSRPAPEPSSIQIQQHFDPFSTYEANQNYPNLIPAHPNIVDDISAQLSREARQEIVDFNTECLNNDKKADIKLFLSSLLPSPCLGLFPFVLLMSVTSIMMMRPFEYPSPVVALETITISTGKLITTLASFASVLPAKAPVAKVADQPPAAQAGNQKGGQNKGKAPQPPKSSTTTTTTAAASAATITTPHTHIPSYAHIPELQPFLKLTMVSLKNPAKSTLLLPPPLSPYFAYMSLSEQLMYIVQSFSTLNPNIFTRSLISSIINNELDYFGVGRIDAVSEHYLRSKAPAMQGYIELPLPAKPLQVFEDFYLNADDSVTQSQPAQPDAKNKPASGAARQKAQKQQQLQKQNAIKKIEQLDDDFFMGHRVSKLSPAQQINISFSKIFAHFVKMYILPINKQRRTFMNNMTPLHAIQVESEEYDREYITNITKLGLYSSTTPKNPSCITAWPLYSLTTCNLLEQLMTYFLTSIQLGMVTGKEYFLFLYILEYITQHNFDIEKTFSRRVGVKEGIASTGPYKPQLSFHYISYSTQFTPTAPSKSGFIDFCFTDPHQTAWKSPQIITSAQTYGNMRYLPQPLITAQTSLKKKATRYTPDEWRSFCLSFPTDDSDSQVYQAYEYHSEQAQWMLPGETADPGTSPKPTSAPSQPTTAKPGPKTQPKPQPKSTTATPTPGSKPTTTQLPKISHPPQHPTTIFMRIYHLLFTSHLRVLVCAKILGVDFANHILLSTLEYDTTTNTFSIKSQGDQILLEKYFSNRYSLLYRTFYPPAQSFQDWLSRVNDIAKEGPKALISTVSQNIKQIKTKLTQFQQLYSGTLSTQPSTPEQLSLLTRYHDTPNNTVYSDLNKHSTTQPNHQAPFPAISPIALTDIHQFQCDSFNKHITNCINPVLMYLLKVNSKKMTGGKLVIKFSTNLDPDHTFATILPDITVVEGTPVV